MLDSRDHDFVYSCFASVQQHSKKKRDDKEMYCTLGAAKAKYSPSLSQEKLSRMWSIGLKTTIKTLYSTTHQQMVSTGLLAKQFRTDKEQLRYEQISCWCITFYVDYLKFGVK